MSPPCCHILQSCVPLQFHSRPLPFFWVTSTVDSRVQLQNPFLILSLSFHNFIVASIVQTSVPLDLGIFRPHHCWTSEPCWHFWTLALAVLPPLFNHLIVILLSLTCTVASLYLSTKSIGISPSVRLPVCFQIRGT